MCEPVTVLCWLRRDLRQRDNVPLREALAEAAASGGRCLPVFVLDRSLLARLPDRDDRRVAFLWESVVTLRDDLRALGGDLLVLHDEPVAAISRLAAALPALRSLHFAPDSEPANLARDARVEAALAPRGVRAVRHKDHVVFWRDEVLTRAGMPCRVFTPYRNAWTARLGREPEALADHTPGPDLLARLAPPESVPLPAEARDLASFGFAVPSFPMRGGEAAARERLETFLPRLPAYARERDRPDRDGTSGLSPDLRFGTLSVREMVRVALADGSEGARKWLDELVWREFYQMLLHHFPSTTERAFQERYEAVDWDDPRSDARAAERLDAWRAGRTGYPVVDASMRELAATGRLHNRLRMVVASFLTKDLHVHWKHGERWFARWLLDYELASNVGGWQWAASTGADGQPWFRVFHPVSQGERWDPDGVYVRRWCPELANLPTRWVHAPWTAPPLEASLAGLAWPAPVVDHATERENALERFRSVSDPRSAHEV